MKLNLVLAAMLIACLAAFAANAGTVGDADGDTVPDAFDNCTNDDNGPNTVPANNQTDLDGDGIGVRCDPDYNQDNTVGVGDFNIFFQAFTGAVAEPRADHNQDGTVGVGDFIIFDEKFQAGVPGPPTP